MPGLRMLFRVAGIIAVPIATRIGLGAVHRVPAAGLPVLTLPHVDVGAIRHFAEFGKVMMRCFVGLEGRDASRPRRCDGPGARALQGDQPPN